VAFLVFEYFRPVFGHDPKNIDIEHSMRLKAHLLVSSSQRLISFSARYRSYGLALEALALILGPSKAIWSRLTVPICLRGRTIWKKAR